MHHQSVNKSPSLFSLAAIRSMFLFVSSRIPVFSVIPPGVAYGRSPAKAGIPSTIPNTVPHSQFSILNFQFPHLPSFSLYPASFIIPLPSPVIPDRTPVIPPLDVVRRTESDGRSPGGAYGRSLAKAGIPEIPASRRSDNMESHPHSVPSNFNFSILNFQFLSPRLLLTLLILPFIFALDLVYFTLARPGCAACGSLSGFLSTSSLTLTMINQNDTITSAFHSIKTIVARI